MLFSNVTQQKYQQTLDRGYVYVYCGCMIYIPCGQLIIETNGNAGFMVGQYNSDMIIEIHLQLHRSVFSISIYENQNSGSKYCLALAGQGYDKPHLVVGDVEGYQKTLQELSLTIFGNFIGTYPKL